MYLLLRDGEKLAAQTKKLWKKPELIVLTRNTPEESVLWFCKVAVGGGHPFNYADGCQQKMDGVCAPGSQCCCTCQSGSPS